MKVDCRFENEGILGTKVIETIQPFRQFLNDELRMCWTVKGKMAMLSIKPELSVLSLDSIKGLLISTSKTGKQ